VIFVPIHDFYKLGAWVHNARPGRLIAFSASPNLSETENAASNRASVEKSPHNQGNDMRRRDLLRVAGITIHVTNYASSASVVLLDRSGGAGFVVNPRQVIITAPDNRYSNNFRYVVAMVLFDVFCQRV
jgi:hypothetical protein